jgi:hypothetical protein
LGIPQPPEPTDEQRALFRNYELYCQRVGVSRSFPATPALAAAWLQTLDDAHLEAAVAALVAIHDQLGLSNPCATLACRTVLERRLRTECPRSWDKEARQLFASLPPEVRAILTARENARDAALRRKQNELAALTAKLKETKDEG